MGIGQVLTMPLFFASNAIYPIEMMPSWLKVLSQLNPLTYQVDLLRSTMIVGGPQGFPIGVDLLVLAISTLVVVVIASRLYPGLAQ